MWRNESNKIPHNFEFFSSNRRNILITTEWTSSAKVGLIEMENIFNYRLLESKLTTTLGKC